MTGLGRVTIPDNVVARAVAPTGALRRLDWLLLAAVLSLAGIGALLVWSATSGLDRLNGGDPQAFLKRHVLNLAIGLVLGAIVAVLDHRTLRTCVPFVYLLSLAGLAAVLSPLGSTINGSHSWIVLPAGFSVQPSEFAKVAVCLGLAFLLSDRDYEAGPANADIILALIFAAVPLALILLQPDMGTALVICVIVLGIVAIAGAPARWVAGLVATAAVAAAVVLRAGMVNDYQLARFTAFLDPSADPSGIGYSTQQARIAIGSGHLQGTGLFAGPQTQGHFVPEQQTDFIFTVAGEELGLLGAGLIVLLFGVVLWRTGRIAARADDLFGRLVATGVLCWFAFQMFENIGMTLGIMPVTGVPLPFVSYGGSSMFANLVAIGLLQNIHLQR